MAAKDDLGRAGEERAARYLTSSGYEILDRNWRCPQGELDIVAVRGGALVFIEVKTRSTLRFGHPLEAVDERKRRRLWQLGRAWARAHPEHTRHRSLRVDVVAITGTDPSCGDLEHLVDLS